MEDNIKVCKRTKIGEEEYKRKTRNDERIDVKKE